MLKLKIHLNFPHRFPSVNPFVPWIHWFTPQLRLDTEISFVPRFNRSIRGGVKGYFQSVQSNRRSLKRWKQVAYSAPWSMKPMQPSCRWFDEFATPFSLSLSRSISQYICSYHPKNIFVSWPFPILLVCHDRCTIFENYFGFSTMRDLNGL